MNSVSILVVTAMSACFGQVVGRAFEEVGAVGGMALGLLTGLAAGTVAAVRPPDPAGVTWRRIEFFTFPVAGIVILALTSGAIGVMSVIVTLFVVVTIRTLVDSTAGDLRMIELLLDDRPTGAPADRMRLRMLGVGLFLAAVTGYTVGVEAGFTDLSRSAVGGQMIAVVGWFALGIASVGVVSRRARQRAWRVNGVRVGDGLSERWAAGVAGVVLVVVAAAVVTPLATSQVSAVPAQVINRTDGLNRFVTRALELLSRDIAADQSDRPAVDDDNLTGLIETLEPATGDRPGWIGDVLLASVIATIFVWAIRAGRNVRFARGGRPVGSGSWDGVKALLAALWRELVALFRTILRLFAALRWRRRPARTPGVNAPRPERRSVLRHWSPVDATERRIARSFATIAELESPRRGETPSEVARSVGQKTDPAGADTVLGGYLRARYSTEHMEEATAEQVEAAAKRVTDAAQVEGDGEPS